MRRTKPILGAGLFVVIVLAVTLASHAGHAKDDLLARATRVASVQGWPLGDGEVFWNDPYLWLSDHELFHFTGDTMHGYQPLYLDTRTCADVPAPGLTPTYGGHIASASPDGRWVLWDTGKWENSRHILAATSRDGARTMKWPEARDVWEDQGFWLSDSRRWVAITYQPTGQTFQGHPASARSLAIYSVDKPGVIGMPLLNDTGTSRILGVTPQDKIILCDATGEQPITPGQRAQPLTLLERSLDPKHPQERQVQVARPDERADTTRFLLSPQGDRIAWFLFSARPSTIEGWLSLWTKHGYLVGRETLDVWVGRLDGSAPHKIGGMSGSHVSFPAGPRWTPDGKRISFVNNGILYTVPAD